MNRIKIYLVTALLMTGMVFQGCQENDVIKKDDPGTAPPLPPIESMVADFSFPKDNDSGGRFDPQTQNNFLKAGVNVAVCQAILAINLAIPVAAFHKAFDNSFTYQKEDGKWLSEYTVTTGGHTVTAKLYASTIESGSKVLWEMYLTVPGEFEDFLWFTGESNADNTGGTWVLYKSPSEPETELLNIAWVREEGEAVESTYLIVDEGSEYEGSYIHYGETDEEGYTHFYEVHVVNAMNAYELEIFANEDTKAGRVKSSQLFEDEEWHCWDENLEDVDC